MDEMSRIWRETRVNNIKVGLHPCRQRVNGRPNKRSDLKEINNLLKHRALYSSRLLYYSLVSITVPSARQCERTHQASNNTSKRTESCVQQLSFSITDEYTSVFFISTCVTYYPHRSTVHERKVRFY